ncbi:MAG TPA: hypothetical protein VK338_01180 [Candidatus Nitrosocosmicus sp.]|nr:hypothetical protein [Candidatus Nitrosocosmicus sp.]
MARTIRTSDINVPKGYKIEAVLEDLSSPTMVTFDNEGRMLIAESGYDDGGKPKVSRIEKNGTKTILTKEGVFGEEIPITSVAFYQNKIYVVHAGTVSVINKDGTLNDIITELPGQGDHQANSLVFKDNKMYLSIGTVTNSGVVGPDNAVFGWLKKDALKQLHDIPCKDITLTENASFESDDVSGQELPKVKTSAYSSFGQEVPAGTIIPGNVKCNGAILSANLDGSNLQVYAWGLRNPYGLHRGPDGFLYASMHGFDARGSRPIENAWDCLYKIEEGAWYGFPDFACDIPVTDSQFKPKDQPQPQFIMANHPTENPPKPIAKFSPHAAANGFAFSPSGWGNKTDVYLALFGDFTPATGTVKEPQGVKIVKVDTTNGNISDFITNKQAGQASRHSAGGLEHPSSVTFGPDGNMYIADWGIARVSEEGLKLDKNSGVVWKVSKDNSNGEVLGGTSLYKNILMTLLLALITALLLKGNDNRNKNVMNGALKGIIAGLIFGVATMIISKFILDLPWYAPPRVMATLVMGSAALANILNFDLTSFVVGLVVVIILTAVLGVIFEFLRRTDDRIKAILGGLFFGLTVWSIHQYFIFPLLQPLITEKGFPPLWYAVSFAIFGMTLGSLINTKKKRR